MLKKIKSQQKKTDRVKSMVKSTLDGAVQQMKRDIRMDVDRFFDHRSGDVVPALVEFVKGYNLSFTQYQDRIAAEGFSNTLYLVFQDLKLAIDTYMAEHINPQIFNFVKNEELKIRNILKLLPVPMSSWSTTRCWNTMVPWRAWASAKLPEMENPWRK